MGAKTDPRDKVLSQVGDTLRVLAANIIGIVRGAGKPLELSRDVDAFSTALDAFEGTTGGRPKAWELAEMLRVDLDLQNAPHGSPEEMAEHYAQHAIVQVSLQLAATLLLKREADALAAHEELHKALRGLEETKRKIEMSR
jgi:hypothetical protein